MTSDGESPALERIQSFVASATLDVTSVWTAPATWTLRDPDHWLVSDKWAETALPFVQAGFALRSQPLLVAALLEGAMVEGWQFSSDSVPKPLTDPSVWGLVGNSMKYQFKFKRDTQTYDVMFGSWSDSGTVRGLDIEPWGFVFDDDPEISDESLARQTLERCRDSSVRVLCIDPHTLMHSETSVFEFDTSSIVVPEQLEVGGGDVVVRDASGNTQVVLVRGQDFDGGRVYEPVVPLSACRVVGGWDSYEDSDETIEWRRSPFSSDKWDFLQ